MIIIVLCAGIFLVVALKVRPVLDWIQSKHGKMADYLFMRMKHTYQLSMLSSHIFNLFDTSLPLVSKVTFVVKRLQFQPQRRTAYPSRSRKCAGNVTNLLMFDVKTRRKLLMEEIIWAWRRMMAYGDMAHMKMSLMEPGVTQKCYCTHKWIHRCCGLLLFY